MAAWDSRRRDWREILRTSVDAEVLVERAKEFLRHEDGVLGDVYQIMAAFAAEQIKLREREV